MNLRLHKEGNRNLDINSLTNSVFRELGIGYTTADNVFPKFMSINFPKLHFIGSADPKELKTKDAVMGDTVINKESGDIYIYDGYGNWVYAQI